jgi:Raf kinase inhibitor-like YbhB/YbcL family protein
LQLRSDNFEHSQPIPPKLAFAKRGTPIALSDNLSPHLAWKDAPLAARSYVLTCIDFDVPSKLDDVNQEGRVVPADLPRGEFVHWLMANIPVECGELAEGACSEGIVAHGKRAPYGPPGSVQGINDYTGWFASDADMRGEYLGYDGPCPPWNDALVHRYHFRLYALDVEHLKLADGFTVSELRAAMDGHVLAEAELMGSYTLNPALT